MLNSWIVLLPPLIAIALAIITRRIVPSLFIGIILTSLLIHNGDITASALFIIQKLWKLTDLGNIQTIQTFWHSDKLFTYFLLILLGVLKEILHTSGAAYAFGLSVVRKIKKQKSLELATLGLSFFFFIDDYFNCLTVGSIISSFSDKFRVPRLKIAMILVAISAPMAVLIPFSSWIATIMSYLKNAGVSMIPGNSTHIIVADPYITIVHAIPFLIYPLITVISIWYIVLSRNSYGIVKMHERIAQTSNNMFGNKEPLAAPKQDISDKKIARSSIVDFLLPITTLLVFVFLAICYDGNCWLLGGDRTMVQTVQTANFLGSFFIGSLLAVVVSLLFFLAQKKLSLQESLATLKEGFLSNVSTIVMLIVVWTLCDSLDVLGTGAYLASFVSGHITLHWCPLIFFLIAAVMSALMATAWGTMGMMIPLCLPIVTSLSGLPIPIAAHTLTILPAVIGAIISGALVGNHISPISDIMFLASKSTGAYHTDVVKNQLGFTIPSIISTICTFVALGILSQYYDIGTSGLMALISGVCLNIIIIRLLAKRARD